MEELPIELILNILNFYDGINLSIICVSKYFYNIIGNKQIAICPRISYLTKNIIYSKLNRLYIVITGNMYYLDINFYIKTLEYFMTKYKFIFVKTSLWCGCIVYYSKSQNCMNIYELIYCDNHPKIVFEKLDISFFSY